MHCTTPYADSVTLHSIPRELGTGRLQPDGEGGNKMGERLRTLKNALHLLEMMQLTASG